MFKLARLFLISLLVVSCTKEPEPKPTTPLIVKTGSGDIRFNVEVASTPEDLQTGLMNRSTLAFNSGMIFNIYPVRPTAMWMKNTKIPLDMLFVAPDGSVSLIYENTKPMSEDLLISRDPVRAVIELNAGQVKRHGIKVGDKVNHALLNNMLDVKSPAAPAKAEPQKADKPDVAVPNLKSSPDVPEVPDLIVPAAQKAPAATKSAPDVRAATDVRGASKTPAKIPSPAPAK